MPDLTGPRQDDTGSSFSRSAADLSGVRTVYAVGTEAIGPVKIGIAYDMKPRLRSLQNANWRRVYIWHCIHTERKDARRLEKEAHRVLKEMGLHVRDEWFALDATEAIAFLDKLAQKIEAPTFSPSSLVRMFDPVAVQAPVEGQKPRTSGEDIAKHFDWLRDQITDASGVIMSEGL